MDWFDRLRGFRLRDLTLDTEQIKAVNTSDDLEFRLRALSNGLMVVALLAAFQMWGLLVWYAARFSYLGLYLHVVRRLPDQLTFPRSVFFAALTVVESFSFVGLSLFFWQQELPVFKAFAVLVIASSMIATLWTRARSPFLWICDAIATGFCMLSLPVLYVLEGQPVWHGAMMAVVFMTVVIYFVLSLFSIWKDSVALERAQAIEVQRSRVEAMGRLTGGVAHDFNNLLTVILGNIELARLSADARERDTLLAEAQGAGTRAARLTAQLLGFARQSVLSPQPVRLSDCVLEARALLDRLLPANVSVHVDPMLDTAPMVLLDAGKFEAVIINLALNARDAMPEGGEISFSATVPKVVPHQMTENQAVDPKDYIVFEVADTGCGIPAEILDKVTEPFFTTKDIGKGSGLGLSMAKGFSEQTGGALEISSVVQQGTRVRLFFPIYRASRASAVH